MDENRRLRLDAKYAVFLQDRCEAMELIGVDWMDERQYRAYREANYAFGEHMKRIGKRYKHHLTNPIQGHDRFLGLVIALTMMGIERRIDSETV